MLVVCCEVWVGVFGWRVFFRVVAGGIWGCGCRRPVPNLKLAARPPGVPGVAGFPLFSALVLRPPSILTELVLRPPKIPVTGFWGSRHIIDRPRGSQ